MAAIISLSNHAERRSARPMAASSHGGAEILLFTGIRYERLPDAEQDQPAHTQGADRRLA